MAKCRRVIDFDCAASLDVPQPHARRAGASVHQFDRLWPAMVDKRSAARPFALWPMDAQSAVRSATRSSPGSSSPMRFCMAGNLAPGRQHVRALHVRAGRASVSLGPRRFSIYYFACVIGAALTQLWVAHAIYPAPYATMGASGGIFGILLFYGMTFPHRQVLLLLPADPDAGVAVRDAVRRAGAVSGCVRDQPGRGAFRAPGRHGDRLRADPLLAHSQPTALAHARSRIRLLR